MDPAPTHLKAGQHSFDKVLISWGACWFLKSHHDIIRQSNSSYVTNQSIMILKQKVTCKTWIFFPFLGCYEHTCNIKFVLHKPFCNKTKKIMNFKVWKLLLLPSVFKGRVYTPNLQVDKWLGNPAFILHRKETIQNVSFFTISKGGLQLSHNIWLLV